MEYKLDFFSNAKPRQNICILLLATGLEALRINPSICRATNLIVLRQLHFRPVESLAKATGC